MWALIQKDLLRRWRSPVATLTMLLFPLFMTGAIGSLVGNGGGGPDFPPIHFLVENRDVEGFVSGAILGSLGQEEATERLDPEIVDVGEGEAMMEKGEASALVVLPENFTEDVLEGRPTALTVVRNPAEGIAPEIIVQGAEAVSTYLDQAGRLLGGELSEFQGLLEADELPDPAKVGALAAGVMTRVQGVQHYLFPPLVKIESVKEKSEKESGPGFSVFGYILVMTTVMAVLFVAVRSVFDLFEEQKSGMLRRQAASPLPVSRIILAKLLFGVVLGVIVVALLAGIGLLFGWIEAGVDGLAALLLTVAFSAAACGLVAVVFGLSRNEKQAGVLAWLLVMGMSALGGSMIPVENMPQAMRPAATWTLNYWVIDGYKQVLFFGGGVAGILQALLVLLGFAGLGLVVGHALLSRRLREVRP